MPSVSAKVCWRACPEHKQSQTQHDRHQPDVALIQASQRQDEAVETALHDGPSIV